MDNHESPDSDAVSCLPGSQPGGVGEAGGRARVGTGASVPSVGSHEALSLLAGVLFITGTILAGTAGVPWAGASDGRNDGDTAPAPTSVLSPSSSESLAATAGARNAKQLELLDPTHRERQDEHVPERMRAFFDGFDENDNRRLDVGEARAFFAWVEENVTYRYDDETTSPEDDPGIPIGDGRQGSDYQQTPVETFEEQRGDCEDTSLLQMAFYAYWGVPAYMAFVDTTGDEKINHALAIVRVGGLTNVSASPEAEAHYYAIEDTNAYDVPAGTYAIVDNAYSDRFGAISGGIDPGTFTIHDIQTLEQRLVPAAG